MAAEIQNKREEHLTVYKKNSLDRGDESVVDSVQAELHSTVERLPGGGDLRSRAKKMKSVEDDESSEDDEGSGDADDTEERINKMENFKVLQGELIETELERNDFGFGLALTGHRDRNRMGTFVCGIHPKGAAAADGALQIGDELLKFHKTVVRGRSHLNVSAIIKKVPVDLKVKVVALRGAVSSDKAAVKKFTQFPAKLDDVVSFFTEKTLSILINLCFLLKKIFASPEFEKFVAKHEVKMQKVKRKVM